MTDDLVLKLIRAVFFCILFCSIVLLLLDTFPAVGLWPDFLGIYRPMKLDTVFLLKLMDVWFGLTSFFFELFLCLNLWMLLRITDRLLW